MQKITHSSHISIPTKQYQLTTIEWVLLYNGPIQEIHRIEMGDLSLGMGAQKMNQMNAICTHLKLRQDMDIEKYHSEIIMPY